MGHSVDLSAHPLQSRLRSLTRGCEYVGEVGRSWLLLLLIDLHVWSDGINAIQRKVERQRASTVMESPTWSSVELCHALDLACVFYFKRVRCLQHSAALTLLLRRHGWNAEMVMGAQILPASFHAWTQIGDTVVNDGPDVVGRYRVWTRW